jgi:hypothetical protein
MTAFMDHDHVRYGPRVATFNKRHNLYKLSGRQGEWLNVYRISEALQHLPYVCACPEMQRCTPEYHPRLVSWWVKGHIEMRPPLRDSELHPHFR